MGNYMPCGDYWPYEGEAATADPGIYEEPIGGPEDYDDIWWEGWLGWDGPGAYESGW